jgi:peptide deformylase
MAIRSIVFIPDPVLRRKARQLDGIDKDLQVIIDDMIETMREAPGVGLAAPQIGESIRLIVVEYGEEPEQKEGEEVKPVIKKLYVMINPEITAVSEEVENAPEACLSVPGLVGEVERHQKVTVKALNRFGKPTRVRAEGWLARIFQHEIDHLDGIIYTDRATQVWQPTPEEQETIKD